jgi:hypothetical protein
VKKRNGKENERKNTKNVGGEKKAEEDEGEETDNKIILLSIYIVSVSADFSLRGLQQPLTIMEI